MYGYDLIDVLLITIPASIIGILDGVRHGQHVTEAFDDDVEYQRRLAAGGQPPAPPAEIVLSQFAKRSVAIFLLGVAAIVFRPLRGAPSDGRGGGAAASRPMSMPLIQMFMLSAAALHPLAVT